MVPPVLLDLKKNWITSKLKLNSKVLYKQTKSDSQLFRWTLFIKIIAKKSRNCTQPFDCIFPTKIFNQILKWDICSQSLVHGGCAPLPPSPQDNLLSLGCRCINWLRVPPKWLCQTQIKIFIFKLKSLVATYCLRIHQMPFYKQTKVVLTAKLYSTTLHCILWEISYQQWNAVQKKPHTM